MLPLHRRFKGFNGFHLAVVIILLLIQLAIRTHNVSVQEAFLDEGFHVERAELAWKFQTNPGQTSDGKFLLYYWLGLFAGPHANGLAVSRLAIALTSLVTGATLYVLGRILHSPRAGLLALALYAIFPLSLFYERMAMADPFAAVFGCLIVWRSIVFARHPTRTQSIILGVLLAAGTMAKLTTIMLPLFPIVATLLYLQSDSASTVRQIVTRWRTTYLKPLLLSWGVLIILWLPILIPALAASLTAHPFNLLDTTVVISTGDAPQAYLVALAVNTSDYTGPVFLVLVLISLISIFFSPRLLVPGMVILFWIGLYLLPMIGIASQPTPRYIMIAGAPAVLLLALVISVFSISPVKRQRLFGYAISAVMIGWTVLFAIPFNATLITRPATLPVNPSNLWTIESPVTTTRATREGGEFLRETVPASVPIYADWTACRLMLYYVDSIHCLDRIDVMDQINEMGTQNQPAVPELYLVLVYYPFKPDVLQNYHAERVMLYQYKNQKVTTWRLWR